MLEMILALSMLLMICLVLLPYQIIIMKEQSNNHLLSTGLQLLNEELQNFMYEDGGTDKRTVTFEKKQYQINWSYDTHVNANTACITWQDDLNRQVEKCGYAKR